MEKKILFGTLGGALTLFLLGGLTYGLLLSGAYEELISSMSECMVKGDEMPIWVPIVANVLIALLLSLLFSKLGISTFKTGVIHGAWIALLISLWFDTWMFGTLKGMSGSLMVMDSVANTIMGALAGGVVGWILGKVK